MIDITVGHTMLFGTEAQCQNGRSAGPSRSPGCFQDSRHDSKLDVFLGTACPNRLSMRRHWRPSNKRLQYCLRSFQGANKPYSRENR